MQLSQIRRSLRYIYFQSKAIQYHLSPWQLANVDRPRLYLTWKRRQKSHISRSTLDLTRHSPSLVYCSYSQRSTMDFVARRKCRLSDVILVGPVPSFLYDSQGICVASVCLNSTLTSFCPHFVQCLMMFIRWLCGFYGSKVLSLKPQVFRFSKSHCVHLLRRARSGVKPKEKCCFKSVLFLFILYLSTAVSF